MLYFNFLTYPNCTKTHFYTSLPHFLTNNNVPPPILPTNHDQLLRRITVSLNVCRFKEIILRVVGGPSHQARKSGYNCLHGPWRALRSLYLFTC